MLELARKLGYCVGSNQDIYGCPVCKATHRHTKSNDKRGAVWADAGWYCFQCEAKGMPQDFQAYHEFGKPYKDLTTAERRRLGSNPSQPPKPLAVSRPSYPDNQDILEYWEMCSPLAEDNVATAYLEARFARKLPEGGIIPGCRGVYIGSDEPPTWATNWISAKRHLNFALYDKRLKIRSVLARTVAFDTVPKSLSPKGFQRKGLFMYQPGDPTVWVITEGEIDFMALSLFCPQKPSIIGMFAGGLDRETFDYIVPMGADVIVATDWDEQGEKYFRQICTWRGVRRWLKPSPTLRNC